MQSVVNDSTRTEPLNFSAKVESSSSSFLKNLWNLIAKVAKKVFDSISHFFGTNKFFSKREITLLRDERPSGFPNNLPLTPLTQRQVTIEAPSGQLLMEDDDTKISKEPAYNKFDDSLEGLRLLSRDFAILGIDTLYEKQISTHMESIQSIGPSLPPFIKSIAKLVVEVGDKAAKPIYKKFAEQKAQTIDPTLKKIFRILIRPDQNELREKLAAHLQEALTNTVFGDDITAADYIDPLVNWFSNSELQRAPLSDLFDSKLDKKRIKELFLQAEGFWHTEIDAGKRKLFLSLEQQLIDEFKNIKIPEKQNIENDYIRPILTWLLLTDHSIPLYDLFGTMNVGKEEIIDKIFEKVITLLVEKKIDQYSAYLEKTIHGHLGNIVHQMMQKNATRITDFFSERISELIASMPFTEMVDSFIEETIASQIQGIITAENAYVEEKQFLEKAKTIAKIVPSSPESLEAQIRAQNHLNSVNQHGDEEAYLQHARAENFSKQPGCHPQLQHLIEQEIRLIVEGKDPAPIRRATEKAQHTVIAEKLLNLMMPVRKQVGASGEIEEIDPFAELWERLYFPEELNDLFKQTEELTQEFLTPETTALLEKIKQPTIEIVKNVFKSTTKDLLKKQLIEVVKTGFEKITTPESLDQINADDSLPNINLLMVETFAKHELGRNLQEFAPLFYKLVKAEGVERETQFKAIQHALSERTLSKFSLFNPAEFYSQEVVNDEGIAELKISGLTPDDWEAITEELILLVEQSILKAQINQQAFNPAKTSVAEISDIIKKTISSSSKKNNPIYGSLSIDLLFRLGNFNSEWLINTFMKDSLSRSITDSMEPWRESHDLLINKTTRSLRRTLNTLKATGALLSDEPEAPKVLVQKNLAHQIDVTARLSHDLIMGIARENGAMIKFATTQILSNKSDNLNAVITRAYRKLFGDQLINRNLTMNVCDKIYKALLAASEKLEINQNIQIHQLAATRLS